MCSREKLRLAHDVIMANAPGLGEFEHGGGKNKEYKSTKTIWNDNIREGVVTWHGAAVL